MKFALPYDALLAQCTVPPQRRGIYKKWLRYYLDFCHKYHFAAEQQASLPAFAEKLHSKQQSEILCEQARQAVLLYYELDFKATLSQAADNQSLAQTVKLLFNPDRNLLFAYNY